jgi:hypothetical protein
LNEVAAGVVQLCDGRAGYLGRRHGELGAARFDALVVALDVGGEEYDRGLALLEYGLLIGLSCRVVVEGELQLGSVRLLGDATVSQRNDPLLKSAFLVKPMSALRG